MFGSKYFIVLLLSVVLAAAVAQKSERRQTGSGRRQQQDRDPEPPKKLSASSQERDDGASDGCPEENGFYADADQCDKYFECRDGVMIEKLCPDGMVFNDYSPDQEKCDLPFNIDCSQRPKLQEPQTRPHCPRLNGYFGHELANMCDKFYNCVDGSFSMYTCPDGLVFNPKTGICTWPDEAQKKGCSSADVFNFTCPKEPENVAATHPRYADEEDCQFFYVCINGETPRRNGCKLGQVFDESQKRCEWAKKVPECADWYKDRLSDKEYDALVNPTPKPTTAPKVKVPSRRKAQQALKRRQQQANESDEQ